MPHSGPSNRFLFLLPVARVMSGAVQLEGCSQIRRTLSIVGGFNGLAQREVYYRRALEILSH
ncbi:MAG TPA: hypothetical protein VEZ71_01765 [Archangium sp.]|nr:hypothetical protein [Archangium sp.]